MLPAIANLSRQSWISRLWQPGATRNLSPARAGRRAACHWAWRDQLALFGAIPDPARVARDGRYITGGGVTAGIDFALTVVAELAGDDMAQSIQLAVEYAPDPPFNAGRPETAPEAVLRRVTGIYGKGMDERRAAAEKAAEGA